MRRDAPLYIALASALLVVTTHPFAGYLAGDENPNAYFNAMTARSDHWKSTSLRTQPLIDSVSLIKPNQWVTYDASFDAAKAVIPAFMDIGLRLGPALAPSADRIVLDKPLTQANKNLLIANRGIRVGNEIMTVHIPGNVWGTQFPDDLTLLVQRAQFGTSAGSHAGGAMASISQNNLLSYLRVPLGTEDGNTYLFTWDVRYGKSYLGTDLVPRTIGRKEFHLTRGPKGSVWLETRVRPEGQDGLGKMSLDRTKVHALIDARHYDNDIVTAPGSNVTSIDSLKPQVGRFVVKTEKWTRFWWFVDQRANDYDYFTLWVADEDTEPVKIFDGLTLRTQGDPNTIFSWWFQLNTSADIYRGATRDLVSHVRNFVALRNPAGVQSLLLRPLAGVPVELPVPEAPQNLRLAAP
jgi:hypothetical protein